MVLHLQKGRHMATADDDMKFLSLNSDISENATFFMPPDEEDEEEDESDLDEIESEEDLDTEDDEDEVAAEDTQHTEGEYGPPFSLQFVEENKNFLKKLKGYVSKGMQLGIARIKKVAKRIRSFLGAEQTLQEAVGAIETEIKSLQPALGADLTTDNLIGFTGGLLEPLSRLPAAPLGKSPVATPTTPSEVLPSLPASASETSLARLPLIPEQPLPWATVTYKPIEDNLTSILFPDAEEVHLPALEAAVETLKQAPLGLGSNYLETAELVKQGSFAITANMTDKALEDVRNTLAKTIEEGGSQQEFIEEVADRLEKEGSPLSPPHIENVFRTNTMSAYSKAQEIAVNNPHISSYFPYAAYYATHDARVRPEHLALEKLGLDSTRVYRTDDPVFKKFRPPWGFQCRCAWVATSTEGAAKLGVKEAVDWIERAKHLAAQQGGSTYQYIERTAPAVPEFVTPPPFEPDPAFER